MKSHQFDFINQRRLSFGQGVRYLLQMEAGSNIFKQKIEIMKDFLLLKLNVALP